MTGDCGGWVRQGSITSRMICATGPGKDYSKDSCNGDSGGKQFSGAPEGVNRASLTNCFCLYTGPLVTDVNGRWEVIGVVSYGAGCAFNGYPGVYARVTEIMSFIEANTKSASCDNQ